MLDKKIHYFIKVVEEKSFSKAAEKLFLSQPNLSKQVKLLEEELGIELLDRKGYRPILTAAGEYYYAEMKKIEEWIKQVEEQLRNIDQQEIRIGFTGSFENRRILEAINTVKHQLENIKLNFIKCSFEDSQKFLLEKEIDISFGVESNFRKHPEVQYDVLYPYEMCVICSFDHPFAKLEYVTPKQLKDQKMILLSRKNGLDFYNDFIAACRLDGYTPKKKKEVNTFDELVFEISTGSGISVVSKEVVREGEVKIVEFRGSHHASNYVVATLKDNHDPVVQDLIQQIKEYFHQQNKNHN